MPSKPPTTGRTKVSKTTHTKKKTALKQPLSATERLKRLFTSLCAQIDGGHFGNAVKTCDKILRIDTQDQDALQTKVFLLLQTEQYGPALSLTEGNEKYLFEKAYSLYRTNQEAGAREALEATKATKGRDDRGIIHLEAQLAYREGSYQVAFDLYNQLLDTAEPHSEEHADILINLEAAQKHLDFIESGYLRALDELSPKISSALETAPPPQPTAAVSLATVSAPAEPETDKKEKKVRLKRVPKGVVPGVTPPPDPERWVKRSERTNFNTGGRRRQGWGQKQEEEMIVFLKHSSPALYLAWAKNTRTAFCLFRRQYPSRRTTCHILCASPFVNSPLSSLILACQCLLLPPLVIHRLFPRTDEITEISKPLRSPRNHARQTISADHMCST